MSGARLWIVLAAVVSFLAGTAAGVLLTRSDDAEPTSVWTAYADRLADDFHLTDERRGFLRILLDEYATALANKRRAYEELIQSQIEPDLRELAARYDGYIRDFVLSPGQQTEFDQRCRPQDLVTAQ
jgi:uncharacterized membrane protein